MGTLSELFNVINRLRWIQIDSRICFRLLCYSPKESPSTLITITESGFAVNTLFPPANVISVRNNECWDASTIVAELQPTSDVPER